MLSVRVPPAELNISDFPPVLRDWVIKGLGMSSLVYATGHIKDPVPLIAKRRGLSPGGPKTLPSCQMCQKLTTDSLRFNHFCYCCILFELLCFLNILKG